MDLSHIINSRLHVFNNVRDLIFDLCRKEADIVVSKAAVLVWFIWHIRNEKVWNDGNTSAAQVGIQAAAYWSQWAAVNGALHDQQQPVQQQVLAPNQTQWQQPAIGTLKCNVDASFFTANGATGWGWCLRDHRGRFKLAATNIIYSSYSVVEGEALALIDAMKEMVHRGHTSVTFECDSKIVVDAISSPHHGLSDFHILISHIKSLLSLHNYFEVKYIKRQANTVAHTLARAAYSMSRRCIFDSIPRCIETVLSNEIY
jgi:ribonuclease HI